MLSKINKIFGVFGEGIIICFIKIVKEFGFKGFYIGIGVCFFMVGIFIVF